MTSQLFKQNVPQNILFELLDVIATKNNDSYIINNASFKKGVYNAMIPEFYIICKQYYHTSKQKYIDRKLTYNSFITIIRQICNHNAIKYTSFIKYDKSKYDILYIITP